MRPSNYIYETGHDTRILRDALGCFATGVCVVTTKDPDGEPVGLTVNSFTSVSLDPPLVLACVARSSGSAELLNACSDFAINVLDTDQEGVSRVFSTRIDDRFSHVDWSEGINGSPIFEPALACIECSKHAVHEGGDHFILVGKVLRARFDPDRQPLLYYGGDYRRLR